VWLLAAAGFAARLGFPLMRHLMRHRFGIFLWLLFWLTLRGSAQVDPIVRNQLQLGYDQPITGKGPQAAYLYYYRNEPQFVRSNLTLRLAVAPAYMDAEVGVKNLISPSTDLGIGIAGGAFGDYYYEVRQGNYVREESFNGHGGGGSVSLYQRLNPGQLVPLHLVGRGGFRYSTYVDAKKTDDTFELPEDRMNLYTRAGLRLAGKEPTLYPDLAMELSVWYERQWRLHSDEYGFNNDRAVNAASSLYWVYAGFHYAWTNVGHKFNLDVTAGGSDGTDRFSAWRLGGVLPLVAEFPLILPGYYFQEISAERFVHLSAGYDISLDHENRWQWRVEGAGARVDYLPGFEQNDRWHAGIGSAVVFTSRSKVLKVALRYGYGFEALRHDEKGAHSVGVLFQWDFEAMKLKRAKQRSGWTQVTTPGING
jgi:hypothetical protein